MAIPSPQVAMRRMGQYMPQVGLNVQGQLPGGAEYGFSAGSGGGGAGGSAGGGVISDEEVRRIVEDEIRRQVQQQYRPPETGNVTDVDRVRQMREALTGNQVPAPMMPPTSNRVPVPYNIPSRAGDQYAPLPRRASTSELPTHIYRSREDTLKKLIEKFGRPQVLPNPGTQGINPNAPTPGQSGPKQWTGPYNANDPMKRQWVDQYNQGFRMMIGLPPGMTYDEWFGSIVK